MPTQEISLQSLIEKVKKELLELPTDKSDIPVFLVDKVELEVAVTVNAEKKGGINISVLELGTGTSREMGHTMRITMTPILSREEQRAGLYRNAENFEKTHKASRALIKGDGELFNDPD